MLHFAKCLTVVLLVTLLTGCPYDFKVPLGTPQQHGFDNRLMGDWVLDDPKRRDPSLLASVLPLNETEYLVQVEFMNGDRQRFRAFSVRIGDQEFWNINLIRTPHPSPDYMLARSRFAPDGRLFLRFIGTNIPASLASNAAGLRDHIQSHLTDPSLDDDDGEYVWRRPALGEIEKRRLRSWSAPSPLTK